MAHPSIEELIPEKSMEGDYFMLFKGLTKGMIGPHQSILLNLEKLVNRRLVYQPKICQLHCRPEICLTSHHILPVIIAGVREFLDALPSLKNMFEIVIDVFNILSPIVLVSITECYRVLQSVTEY